MPCQGRSAIVLVYRECVRAEALPHRGQTEVASAVAALSVMRPALAERQMRSRFCESGRMVWFGIGDLGEWRNVGCPKQHARRFHRKPGRTTKPGQVHSLRSRRRRQALWAERYRHSQRRHCVRQARRKYRQRHSLYGDKGNDSLYASIGVRDLHAFSSTVVSAGTPGKRVPFSVVSASG
jgi:hypothetical protein